MSASNFAWGRQAAQVERGYAAIGGEYLFLLLPFVYYPGIGATLRLQSGQCHTPSFKEGLPATACLL